MPYENPVGKAIHQIKGRTAEDGRNLLGFIAEATNPEPENIRQ
jgi:hypothetical protein